MWPAETIKVRASRMVPLDTRLGNVSLIPLRGSENEMRNSVAAFTADPLAVSPINQSKSRLLMMLSVSPAHLKPKSLACERKRSCLCRDAEKSPSLELLLSKQWSGEEDGVDRFVQVFIVPLEWSTARVPLYGLHIRLAS